MYSWIKSKGQILDRISIIIIIFGILSLYYRYLEIERAPEYLYSRSKINFTLQSPNNMENICTGNSSILRVNDTYNQLIDIINFTFRFNPNPCQDYSAGLLLVVIISSHPNNSHERIAIRNTWGQSSDFVKVVFLLGETIDAAVATDVEHESWLYRDIVLGNFVDAYRNMTYKHLMGLKWVVHHCPMARYVLKADDDVVVNSRELWRFLVRELSPWGARKLMLCRIRRVDTVIRSSKNKWKVTKEEYPESTYPPYCLGAFVLYSQDVVQILLEMTQNLKYFWIDDVQITGIAAVRVRMYPTEMGSLFMDWPRLIQLKLNGKKSVGIFLLCPLELTYSHNLYVMWNMIQENTI